MSVRELAEDYNVERRTVQRDLGDLREAGFILNEKRRTDQRIYYHLQDPKAFAELLRTECEAKPLAQDGLLIVDSCS